jgi:hypothetical protein
MVFGLDMRFLGGKWRRKNEGEAKANRIRRFRAGQYRVVSRSLLVLALG